MQCSKLGVYRHECGGIFTSLEMAQHAARSCADNDRDGHHSYEVMPFELDERVQQKYEVDEDGRRGYFHGDLREPAPVFTVQRQDFSYRGLNATAWHMLREKAA